MTSPAKVKANRANARASTGPKTVSGRRRSARNALRHGLSLPVHADPILSEEVEALAQTIAGPNADPEIMELARRVAEAQIDRCRVRAARQQVLSGRRADPHDQARPVRRGAALPANLPNNSAATAANTEATASPLAADRQTALAEILLQESRTLRALERYERRACSRRKFAIRALDAARRRRDKPKQRPESDQGPQPSADD